MKELDQIWDELLKEFHEWERPMNQLGRRCKLCGLMQPALDALIRHDKLLQLQHANGIDSGLHAERETN